MTHYKIDTPLPPYLPYPRFLLDIPVSETAKLVYVLILSRIRLSQANGWADREGTAYCRYPIGTLGKDAHRSKTTILTALTELEAQGLLTRIREGRGYANKLCLSYPENCTPDARKAAPKRFGKPCPNDTTIYNIKENTYKGRGL